MRYDIEGIKRITRLRKKVFLTRIIIFSLVLGVSFFSLFFFQNQTIKFFALVCAVISGMIIVKTFKRYPPSIVFSKEITGINIKEHEFVASSRGRGSLRGGTSAVLPAPRNVGVQTRGKRTKPPTSATVYLRLEDGEVTALCGLTNAQTDIYEIGDKLYRYPGTVYPIIIGRDAQRQPCPICGTANYDTEDRCITCKLKIEK